MSPRKKNNSIPLLILLSGGLLLIIAALIIFPILIAFLKRKKVAHLKNSGRIIVMTTVCSFDVCRSEGLLWRKSGKAAGVNAIFIFREMEKIFPFKNVFFPCFNIETRRYLDTDCDSDSYTVKKGSSLG